MFVRMVEGLLRSRSAYPADLYTPSSRAYEPPPEPEYPFHDRTVRVTRCGRICVGKRKINLSNVFAGQLVGNREVEDRIWLVSLLHYDLGYYDHEEGRIEPGPNAIGDTRRELEGRRRVRRPVAREPARLRHPQPRPQARRRDHHRRRHGRIASDLVDEAGNRQAHPPAHRCPS